MPHIPKNAIEGAPRAALSSDPKPTARYVGQPVSQVRRNNSLLSRLSPRTFEVDSLKLANMLLTEESEKRKFSSDDYTRQLLHDD